MCNFIDMTWMNFNYIILHLFVYLLMIWMTLLVWRISYSSTLALMLIIITLYDVNEFVGGNDIIFFHTGSGT